MVYKEIGRGVDWLIDRLLPAVLIVLLMSLWLAADAYLFVARTWWLGCIVLALGLVFTTATYRAIID